MEALRDLAVKQHDKYMAVAAELYGLAMKELSLAQALHQRIKKRVGLAEERSQTLREVEAQTIVETINECGGNVSAAAKLLGVSRFALERKIKKAEAIGKVVNKNNLNRKTLRVVGG